MSDHLVPLGKPEKEIRVKNSRFVASLSLATSVKSANAFIQYIEKKYPDASHHVPAYIIGHGTSKISHANDDGEPSGTAGRPALAVLEGSGLGDVVVIITRYFGGTKLGTGGLVRAYSDAVRSVLSVTPKAKKVKAHLIELSLPYSYYETISKMVREFGGKEYDADFGGDVKLTIHIPSSSFDKFKIKLLEITSGAVVPCVLSSDETLLSPLINHSDKG
ncbi:MAG: YigZ family protein [Anaerolineales bacterium]|nr:YigZ family protein [Anaerolineales bacterium]